ncbi:head maturation protease [Mycobacterium phage Rey]|uniref:ClpP-like protease n=1 Tax=Mycobacterium phage Rey TaxID=1034115 RepID=G1D5C7_9CAUD|nr:head maturation protease [Mycobacterium phage Rey]AEK09977.1 ClpP-like protease [Mycobacterium phage Rey]
MSDECLSHTSSMDSTYVVSEDEDGRDVIRYFFRGYINDEAVSPLIEQIYYWDGHYPDSRWEIDINSPGGEIFPSIALFGAVRRHSQRMGGNHHITTRVSGMAASGGELLLQAGDHRVGGLMDMIMIHEPLHSYEDSSTSKVYEDLRRADEWIHRLAVVHCERATTMSPANFRDKLKNGDWWMYTDEALDLGFLDEVEQ